MEYITDTSKEPTFKYILVMLSIILASNKAFMNKNRMQKTKKNNNDHFEVWK